MRKIILSVIFVVTCVMRTVSAQDSLPADGRNAGDIKEEIMMKARQYINEGLFDEAVKYFADITDKYPKMAYPYYCLGLAYYGKEDLANAEANFLKAIGMEPYFPEAYYHLALVAHKKGDPENVLRYLNEVTALDNTFQPAYYNRGVVYLNHQAPKRAIKEFAYSLYLNPDDKDSFMGILEAAKRSNLIVLETPEEQSFVEMQYVKDVDVENTIITPGSKAFTRSVIAPADIRSVRTARSGETDEVDMTGTMPVQLDATKSAGSAVEILFNKPFDFRKRFIKLKLKGMKGDETVIFTMRDAATKRSMPYTISDITGDLKPIIIDVPGVAKNIDLAQVDYLKIELQPIRQDSAEEAAAVFMSEFEVK